MSDYLIDEKSGIGAGVGHSPSSFGAAGQRPALIEGAEPDKREIGMSGIIRLSDVHSASILPKGHVPLLIICKATPGIALNIHTGYYCDCEKKWWIDGGAGKAKYWCYILVV
jgi:hypothetical protein